MAIQLQNRRGTASQWTSSNPTLAAGEIGYESDTGKFKIGNGSTTWAQLSYAGGIDSLSRAGGTTTVSENLSVSGNLTVLGTTTTINSTEVNVQNAFVFEGTTADAYETTLTVVDPTADRTITLPDSSGTVLLASPGRTVTVPTDNGAVVFDASTQTLTNKTISGGSLTNNITANATIDTGVTGSLTISGSVTLTTPTISGGSGTFGNITLNNGKTLTNNGTISGGTISGGSISGSTITGTITSYATISGTISGGTYINPTLSGTLTMPGAASIGNSPTLSGVIHMSENIGTPAAPMWSSVGTISGGTIKNATISGTLTADGFGTVIDLDSAGYPGGTISGGKIQNVNSTGSLYFLDNTDIARAQIINGFPSPTISGTFSGGTLSGQTIQSATLSGTFPTTSATISGSITVTGDINLTQAGGPGSLIDELTLFLMGAL